MRDDVELFTLETAEQEQKEWGEELKAFAGMVSLVRERHFGKSITAEQMIKQFELLVADVEIDSDEAN